MIFALGRHLFESTIFALLAAILTLALHKRGAATRHALWFIAVVKFAVPVATLSAVGLKLQNLLPHSVLPPSAPLRLASFLAHQGAATQLPSAPSTHFHPFVVVWLVGALVMLAVWLPKLFAPLETPDSSGHFDERILSPLKERIGLRREVHIRLSESNVEPALIGFWRPVITIPDTLPAKLSESQLEAVILHELAHAQRLDNWTGAFTHVLACIFWFYPVLWWIERRLYREREHACDEIVVRSGVAPEEYVAGILKVCRFHLNSGVAGVSAVSSSNLKKRMEVIMSLSASRRLPRIPKIVLGSLIIAMTFVPVVIGFASAAMANGQPDSANKQTSKQVNTARPITCVFASVEYPEGTVIQEDGGPEQMCARVQNPTWFFGLQHKPDAQQYVGQWIHTSKEIRERSRNVVRLPQPPVAGEVGRVRVDGNVQSARLVNKVEPAYPALARQGRIEGVVRLHTIIGKDGSVEQLEVISGHPLLQQAALDAVRKWVYQPTLLEGKPGEVDTTIDVAFQLGDQGRQ
jgi:TonB family protein